jgi:hypothetical protein
MENGADPRRAASKKLLNAVYGISVLSNESDNPNVVAVIATPPPDSRGFTLPSTLSDMAITAVLIAHADEGEFNTQIVDELTGREFYARALKADGLRAREELIKADTLEELQQKLDSPHVKYPYLRGRERRAYPDFSMPGQDFPSRHGSLFGDEDLSGLYTVFGSMFGGESFAGVRQAYQQVRQAEAEQAERALMRAFAGTKVTLEVDGDGKFHFTGDVIYNPPAEPQD